MVKVIEAKDIKWADPAAVDEAAKAQAEALADALGELDGRRLDRPTAHKIGKLFQKRLVGRPALIGNDQIATLRRTKAHQENTYRVEVSAPGKSNPHNPHIPRVADQEVVGSGNVGKEGKVSGASWSARSMSAFRTLDAARAAGIEVRLDGKDLVLSGDSEPPPDVLDMLRRHKLSIVALLQRPLVPRRPAAAHASHGTEMTGGPSPTSRSRIYEGEGLAGQQLRRAPTTAASPSGCVSTS